MCNEIRQLTGASFCKEACVKLLFKVKRGRWCSDTIIWLIFNGLTNLPSEERTPNLLKWKNYTGKG